MSDIDHEHVAALLSIVEKCAGHSGKLGSISNIAMAELIQLNDNLREKALEAEKARREDEIKREAAQAEVKRANELKAVETTGGDKADRPIENHPSESATTTLADRRI